MTKKARIKKGIFYLGKDPVFMITAEYPYYRDDAGNWDDRLRKIKDAGIDTVTFYVPWRHHMHKDGEKFTVDFNGKTQPNRDVRSFLKLCAKRGLWVIVKPGPFIHAELTFGGLPDWAAAEKGSGIEAFPDNKGEPMRDPFRKPGTYGRPMPAPLCKKFKTMTKEWYGLVHDNLIKGNIYPNGNIIALQVCNEGVYSNGSALITDYDYSDSALRLYRRFAKRKDVRAPRKLSGIKRLSDLKDYLDWARWQSEYMRLIYAEFSDAVRGRLPIVINVGPPHEGRGLDHWLTRVIPENWPTVNYGFTNWLKPVSEDRSSFDRYSISSKRSRGINLEENWGFSKLYDHRFQYPVVCVFETMLAIANGAAGFNVYTAVNTTSWDDSIDSQHERPYPDSSPIREDGTLTKKYDALRMISHFFESNGPEFLECRAQTSIAWGFYPPYAYLAAWDIPKEDWDRLHLEPVRCGYEGLDKFQRVLRDRNIDFHIVNLETASSKELKAYKFIVLYGGFFMDRRTQQKLASFAAAGGKVMFIGETPHLDEDFRDCRILRKKSFCLLKTEDLGGILSRYHGKLSVSDPETQVWAYEDPKKKTQFFFVLNLSINAGTRYFVYDGKKASVTMPDKSAAVIKVKNGKLDSLFIKGINEMNGTSVVPAASFGKYMFKAKTASDVLRLLVLAVALAFSSACFAEAGDVPINGHKISVDKKIIDWKGKSPDQENTAVVDEGEYIWKDAIGDDTGNGKYAYPQNKALKKGADLKEFRVTFDNENLYLLIKTDHPGDWWISYRIIGIDTDGASGGRGGSQVLAQGNTDDYSFDSGTFAELKVSPELACEYTVALSSTYKGRIWDADGKMIAHKEGQPDDTPGFNVDDYDWDAVEIAIPWTLLGGKPAEGTAWRFVVATGQQEDDVAREIETEPSEWHAGGGETSEANGADPDVFDLAGSDKAAQEKELGSYKGDGAPGDVNSFAMIDRSYLIVKFGK